MADVKLDDLDHENYENEALNDSSEYIGDNGAAEADHMMEDPVSIHAPVAHF